jgi:hypothetical protein
MPHVTTYNFTLQENIMKTLHQLFAAIVLTLTIAVSSSAGNMHTTAPTPPPDPAPASGEISTTANGTIHTTNSDGGDMHTGDTDEATAGDAVVAGALSLLQGVLSLL